MENSPLNSFIERLKKVRGNLSQKEFATRIGAGQNAVSQWETGQNLPNQRFLEAIVKEFNISLDWLVLGKGEPFSEPFEVMADFGPSNPSVRDQDGIFGKTEYKEIDGSKVSVTMFEPKTTQGGSTQDPFADAVSGLRMIFNSGDHALIKAITFNIRSFQDSVAKDKKIQDLQGEIHRLQQELNTITKRLDTVEKLNAKFLQVEEAYNKHASEVPEERRTFMHTLGQILSPKLSNGNP